MNLTRPGSIAFCSLLEELPFDELQSKSISPQAIDMLLIDNYGRSQRYLQFNNPGPLVAEGHSPFLSTKDFHSSSHPSTKADLAEQTYPTLMVERENIISLWAKVDMLRPLLSRPPRREDVPALQALAREQREPRAFEFWNVIAGIARGRLSALHVKAD